MVGAKDVSRMSDVGDIEQSLNSEGSCHLVKVTKGQVKLWKGQWCQSGPIIGHAR